MSPGGTPLCSNDEWAPGGVKVERDLLWLTATCTALTSAVAADLNLYVFAYDPATSQFVDATGAASTAPVIDEALVTGGVTPYRNPQSGSIDYTWTPWVDAPNFLRQYSLQPWAIDIEFTDADELVVGIMDRHGHIVDHRSAAGPKSYGEPARFVRNSGSPGTYVRQEAGVASTFANEFFADDGFYDGNAIEHESTGGALGFRRGSGQLTTNGEDPVPVSIPEDPIYMDGTPPPGQAQKRTKAGGFTHFNTTTGAADHRTIVYSQDTAVFGTFGKANGIGDIEYLCDLAPTEIGNLVWLDTDKDGIQDPSEAGIDGVQVDLLAPDGTLIASKTTANGGLYLFTDADVPGKFQPGVRYALRINPAQAPLSGLRFTVANSGRNQGDSEAVASGVTTGIVGIVEIGANDHTYDFGFIREIDPPTVPPTTPKANTPKLTIKKTGPARVRAGKAITWKVVVRNIGTGTARNVQVVDNLPSGVVLLRKGNSSVRVLKAKRAYLKAKKRYRATGVQRARGRVSAKLLKTRRATAARTLRRYRVARTGMPYSSKFKKGALVIRLGNMAPKAKRTITIRARVARSVGAVRLTNRATARANNAKAVKGAVRTRVVPVRDKVNPAVTG